MFLSRRAWCFALLPLAACRKTSVGGIQFRKLSRGGRDRHYLHVHGNETTARQLLEEHMKSAKGTAFLVRSEKRMVPLGALEIDPNRMFSRAGAESNLRRVNRSLSEAALQNAVMKLERDRWAFARRVLPPPGGLLIALHNNSAGYSVEDEVPLSDEVSLADRAHPHEFMLVTRADDFAIMKRSPFNVVLQAQAEPDDGSMSRLCARLGIRYVNIEAGQGQYERQKQMLEWLEANLP